jgi:molybdopterin-guanine dinucleotide biosynthesis protein A
LPSPGVGASAGSYGAAVTSKGLKVLSEMSDGRSFDAIVLAGAASERFGGRDKALIELGGRSLLERALDAVRGASNVIVVGPRRAGYPVGRWIEEQPAGGGPTAALAAGLRGASQELVIVLAVDMPLVSAADIDGLLGLLTDGASDGVALGTEEGRPQLLVAAYRRARLAEVLEAAEELHGAPLHRSLASLSVRVMVSPRAVDCDTPQDLAALEEIAPG